MSDTATRLERLDHSAAAHPELLVDVINALAAVVESLVDQVALILDYLEVDVEPYPEIVTLPDIATYQEHP